MTIFSFDFHLTSFVCLCRCGQKNYKRKSSCFHYSIGYCTNGDEGNGTHQKRRRNAEFHDGRREKSRKGVHGITFTHPILIFFFSQKIFKEIADTGIIAGSSIGELSLHYFNRFNIAVLKVLPKFDLRRLCRVVSATPPARVGAIRQLDVKYCKVRQIHYNRHLTQIVEV